MLKNKKFFIKCRYNDKYIKCIVDFYGYINEFPVFVTDSSTTCYIVHSNKYGSIIVISKDILTYVDRDIVKAIVTNIVYNKIYRNKVYDINDDFISDFATAKECGLNQTKAALLIMKESFEFNIDTKDIFEIRLKKLSEYNFIEECIEGTHVIDFEAICKKLDFRRLGVIKNEEAC